MNHILNRITRTRVLSELAALDQFPYEISVKQLPVRNAEQSAKMWACLTDIAEQVVWHGQKHDKDTWKDILTAGLKKQRLLPGVDGGLVLVGSSTSKMSIQEMTELIEFILWFGAEHGVKWSNEEAAA